MRSALDGDTSDNTFYNQKQNPKQDLMIVYRLLIRRQKKQTNPVLLQEISKKFTSKKMRNIV